MNNEKYKAGYELAFGDPEVKKGSWIFDCEKGKFVSHEDYAHSRPDAPTIMKALEEFVSPIDGMVITDRGQLRRHNEAHGVSNLSDFGENNGKAYFARKEAERTATINGSTREAKQERVETIKRTLAQHGH
jgi:hypothetical protein